MSKPKNEIDLSSMLKNINNENTDGYYLEQYKDFLQDNCEYCKTHLKNNDIRGICIRCNYKICKICDKCDMDFAFGCCSEGHPLDLHLTSVNIVGNSITFDLIGKSSGLLGDKRISYDEQMMCKRIYYKITE